MEPPIDMSEDDRAAIENKHIVMFEYVGTALLVYISVCAKYIFVIKKKTKKEEIHMMLH